MAHMMQMVVAIVTEEAILTTRGNHDLMGQIHKVIIKQLFYKFCWEDSIWVSPLQSCMSGMASQTRYLWKGWVKAFFSEKGRGEWQVKQTARLQAEECHGTRGTSKVLVRSGAYGTEVVVWGETGEESQCLADCVCHVKDLKLHLKRFGFEGLQCREWRSVQNEESCWV